jgi:hypothetical protein
MRIGVNIQMKVIMMFGIVFLLAFFFPMRDEAMKKFLIDTSLTSLLEINKTTFMFMVAAQILADNPALLEWAKSFGARSTKTTAQKE